VDKKRRFSRLRRTPWPVLVILLIMLPAILLLGPAAIGLAAFGTAIGLPMLLFAFVFALAVVGVITLIKSLRKNPESQSYIAAIVAQIARDESLRQLKATLRKAMVAQPVEPKKQATHPAEETLRRQLLMMDPFEFERHVMSFFQEKHLFAWVTKKSNDAGVDGFARHPEGLIVVQCKRNSAENGIGRPTIQQFKGVIEENGAWRGYVITTSYFTQGAVESAKASARLKLVDMSELIRWHKEGFEL
jgi:restriction system protein